MVLRETPKESLVQFHTKLDIVTVIRKHSAYDYDIYPWYPYSAGRMQKCQRYKISENLRKQYDRCRKYNVIVEIYNLTSIDQCNRLRENRDI